MQAYLAIPATPNLTPTPAWFTILLAGIGLAAISRSIATWLKDPERKRKYAWASAVRVLFILFELASIVTAIAGFIAAGATAVTDRGTQAANNAATASQHTSISFTGGAIVLVLAIIAGLLYLRGPSFIWGLVFGVVVLVASHFFNPVEDFLNWWLNHAVTFVWENFVRLLNNLPGAIQRLFS